MNPIFEQVKQDKLNKESTSRLVTKRLIADFEYRLSELLQNKDISKFKGLSYSSMEAAYVGVHFSITDSIKDLRSYADRQHLKEMFPKKIREHFHNHTDNNLRVWDAWATVDTFCESVEVRFYSNTPPQFLLEGASAFFEAEKNKKQKQKEDQDLKTSILAEEIFKSIPNLVKKAGVWDVDYSSTQGAFTFRAMKFSPANIILLKSLSMARYDLQYDLARAINNSLHTLLNSFNTENITIELENDNSEWRITIPEKTLNLIDQALTDKT